MKIRLIIIIKSSREFTRFFSMIYSEIVKNVLLYFDSDYRL